MLISRIMLVIKCGMITIRIMYTRIIAIIIDKKTLNDEELEALARLELEGKKEHQDIIILKILQR